MDEHEWLARRFDAERARLRGVAFRMLGSLSEADDAVQEAWLRTSRSDTKGVENLSGWLTTVVSRVSLDMLRSRASRREESLEAPPSAFLESRGGGADPEQEAALADSVGLAVLVVLQNLAPAERVAFVLHDMFDVPFEEIATIVGRTPAAARQLASRARRRVRGGSVDPDADIAGQRTVVDAFLGALRAGDFEGLVAVLDPDFVIRAETTPGEAPREVRGARTWASQAVGFSRLARFAQPALVDGAVGAVVAPRGQLSRVLRFTIRDGKVAGVEVIADPERIRQLELAALAE